MSISPVIYITCCLLQRATTADTGVTGSSNDSTCQPAQTYNVK